MDLHLPPLVYVTQSPFQIETCQCLTVHLWRIELDVSSPPPLGPVHGGVGILEQLFHRFAVLRIDRNADTGSHEIAASIDLHRTVQRIADLARHHTDLTGVLDMIEHHHELVAPQPGHQILTPVAILQPLCDRFQHPVSGRMSQTIVDPFEIVQIDEQDPEAVFTSLRMGDSPLEMVLQHAPVGQIGQCIVRGLIAEQCSGTAQVAHIAHGDHTTHHLAAVIVDGGGGTVDVETIPVLGDDDGSLGKQRHCILAPQGGEQQLSNCHPSLILQPEHRLDRPPPSLAIVPAGQFLRRRIHVADAARTIGGDHRITDGVQRHFGTLLLLEQLAEHDMHAPPAPEGVAERNGEHGSHWRKPDAGRIQQNDTHSQRQQQLKKGHRQRPSRTGCAIHQVDRRYQQERHRDLPGKSERNDTISAQQHIGHVGQDLHARHGATRTRARGRRIAFPQTGRRCPHQNIFPGKQLFQLRLAGTEYVHIGKETGSRRKGYQEHLIPHPGGRRPPSGDPVANGGRSFRRWLIYIQQRQGQIWPPWRPDTGPEIAASHLAVRIQLHIDVSQRSGTAGQDLQRSGFL